MTNSLRSAIREDVTDLRNSKLALILLLCIAIGLRLLWALVIYPEPNLEGGDGEFYMTVGQRVAEGNGVSLQGPGYKAITIVGPIYPYLIGLAWTIFGEGGSIFGVRFSQIILACLTVIVAFLVGKRAHSKPVGLIAAGALAFDTRYIIESSEIYTESTFIAMLFLAIWMFTLAVQIRSVSALLIAGAFLGLPALVRPVAQFMPFALCVWLLWRRPNTVLAAIRDCLYLLLGYYLITLPWELRTIIRLDWELQGIPSLVSIAPLLLTLIGLWVTTQQALLNFVWRIRYVLLIAVALVVIGGGIFVANREKPLLSDDVQMHLFMATTEWNWEALSNHDDPYGRDNVLYLYQHTDANGQTYYNFMPAIWEGVRTNLPTIILNRLIEISESILQPHGTVVTGSVFQGIGFRNAVRDVLSGAASFGYVLQQPDFLVKLSIYFFHFVSLGLGILGLLLDRTRKSLWLIVGLVIAYYLAIYGALFIIPRYIFPALLLLHLPSAVLIYRIYQQLVSRNTAPLTAATQSS